MKCSTHWGSVLTCLVFAVFAGACGNGSSDNGNKDGTVGPGNDAYQPCLATFKIDGTITPEGLDSVQISLEKSEHWAYVISGSSGNTLFEALWAAEQRPDKVVLGTAYQFMLDIAEVDAGEERDSLKPKRYTELGRKGAYFREDGTIFHIANLRMEAGDFLEIEEGTTSLYEVVTNPKIKASFQLTVFEYTHDLAQPTTVPATGTLTGRLDGCYTRHNDASGKWQE